MTESVQSYEIDEVRKHVSFVISMLQNGLTKKLLERKDCYDRVKEFVKAQLDSGTGQVLYVSGVSGTGKTQTVLKVLSDLQHGALGNVSLNKEDKSNIVLYNLEDQTNVSLLSYLSNEQSERTENEPVKLFSSIYLNALTLFKPEYLFDQLCALLGIFVPKSVKAVTTQSLVSSYFLDQEKPRMHCILVIDEADFLFSNHSVLYNLLNIPSQPNTKLSIILLANHPSIPPSVSGKIKSRLGIHSLYFPQYTSAELYAIVSDRIQSANGMDLFDADAIKFCCNAFASFCGDARMTLDSTRKALEKALLKYCEDSDDGEYSNYSKEDKVDNSTNDRKDCKDDCNVRDCRDGKAMNSFFSNFPLKVRIEHFKTVFEENRNAIQVNFIRSLMPLGKQILFVFFHRMRIKQDSMMVGELYEEVLRECYHYHMPIPSHLLFIQIIELLCSGNIFRLQKDNHIHGLNNVFMECSRCLYSSVPLQMEDPSRFWVVEKNTADCIFIESGVTNESVFVLESMNEHEEEENSLEITFSQEIEKN